MATQLTTKGRKQAPALQAGLGQPHAVINSAKAPQVICQCHGIQGEVINSLSTQHKQEIDPISIPLAELSNNQRTKGEATSQ